MQATLQRQPNPQRTMWTLGNLLMFVGLYLLLYVGGVYADEAYNREAARGDNNLPVPAEAVQPAIDVADSAPAVAPERAAPQAFVAPDLSNTTADSGDQPAAVEPRPSPVTRVVLPAIDVDSKVVEVGWKTERDSKGDEVAVWEVAKYAVGHHKGSASPGEGSNIVMAGHVGGSGPVFAHLIDTQVGDQVILYSGGRQYLYVVQEVLRVQEVGVSNEERLANASYMAPTATEMVTLITCWPATGPNAFDQRIVVQAVPYTDSTTSTISNWGLR